MYMCYRVKVPNTLCSRKC